MERSATNGATTTLSNEVDITPPTASRHRVGLVPDDRLTDKDRLSRQERDPVSNSILARIASGDADAVDECLEVYGNLVWSIAKRFSKSTADAEDAAQDVFVELWQKADRYDASLASESTFIAMIARRRIIDRLRRSRSEMQQESLDLEVFRDSEDSHQKAELRDEAAKAAKCLKRLPRQQQQVIALSVQQGASHRVISEQLDIPLGTVKTFARRGLIQIRDCMSRRLSVRVEGGVS